MAIASKSFYRFIGLTIIGFGLFFCQTPASAQASATTNLNYLDTLWLLIAGSLVFFMNAGFAMLEAGLCQTRNATNVLAKNLIIFAISMLAFWLFGFGMMFGDGNSWWGTTGFFFQALSPPFNNSFPIDFASLQTLYPQQSFMAVFFFQLVFAGTAATIVSGAVAERIKFWAFFWFSFLLVAIIYPLAGRWIWNPTGWLNSQLYFLDFAGSTVVHSIGGMAGLVGAILLGPRRGWQGYNPDLVKGKKFTHDRHQFKHYNLTFSTLGCLILWLGWLGFNGGSAKAIEHVPHIMVTTMMAATAGGVFVLLLRGLRQDKLTLTTVINGILGGLVAITASSAYVSLIVALFIGAVSSLCLIVVEALLKQCKIDDPVGAVPVHLGCGIWGTFAVGLFVHQLPPYINEPISRLNQIIAQTVGIVAVGLTTLLLSLVFWLLIGLVIYLLELFNAAIKLDTKSERRLLYPAETLKPQSWFGKIFKYLQITRQALRVSAAEETRGNDGTFI